MWERFDQWEASILSSEPIRSLGFAYSSSWVCILPCFVLGKRLFLIFDDLPSKSCSYLMYKDVLPRAAYQESEYLLKRAIETKNMTYHIFGIEFLEKI